MASPPRISAALDAGLPVDQRKPNVRERDPKSIGERREARCGSGQVGARTAVRLQPRSQITESSS
jgi:hypothetical protein